MSINEEITALLNGDLDDESRIAELMHVLAVSPEKRNMLRQQIRMSRAFSVMSTGIVPPPSADQGILAGISAIDREIAGEVLPPAGSAGLSAAAPAASVFASMWLRSLVFGLVLMACGVGAGYLLWHDEEQQAPVAHRTIEPVVQSRPVQDERIVAGLRDSLAMLRGELAGMTAARQTTLRDLATLRADRSSNVRREPVQKEMIPAAATTRESTTLVETPVEQVKMNPAITTTALRSDEKAAPVHSQEINNASGAPLDASSSLDAFKEEESVPGPWHIAMRDHFRLSLPRVYGLADNRSILFDKEVLLGYSLSTSEGSPLSTLQIAAAFGETQFTQVYHTGESGRAPDLIIEQSPTVLYGRVMLASEVFRTSAFSGALELGGGLTAAGGSALGPIGTFGLNVEYRPVDAIALHLGTSSWLLWTEHDGQIYTSTNLNGHLGIALGF